MRYRLRKLGRRISPFQAGLIAIALTAIVVYVAFGGALPWQSPYQLRAVVSSANELHSRTPVRVAGIEVGRVSSVERGPGSAATVTMEIQDKALPIHADATLKVRPRIFLEGNFFVDLRPGTPSGRVVDSGFKIPLGQTAVPVQLDQVLDTLRRNTRENLTRVVHELAVALDGGGARALHRSLPEWAPAFRKGAIAAEAVRGNGRHDLSGFIVASERVSRALASRQSQLVQLITGLDRTVEALASRRAELAASLPELAATLREARPTFVSLNRLFPTARAFAREIRPALREAPATLRLVNPLLTQLGRILSPSELPALIEAGDPAIAALARLQPDLREFLRLLRPVTECARTRVLPLGYAQLDDGEHTSPFPVYSELLHGWVGLASAVQNFDGNGHAVRYHAGFGDQTFTTGTIPSIGEPLVGVTENPIIGSRPKKPATGLPPFRPDAPCLKQKLVNLHAETGAAEPTTPLP
ncbi:MAG TPA: MlaD family protein [Thermoleophilaceae bacterium]|nr:MlaD family protein [Thermoleophilaceae bacterium]